MSSDEIIKRIMTVIAEDCGDSYESLKGYTNDDELPGMVYGAYKCLDQWLWRCKAIEALVELPSESDIYKKARELRADWEVDKELKIQEAILIALGEKTK